MTALVRSLPVGLTALLLSAGPTVTVLDSRAAVEALPARHEKGTHVVHFWATWCPPCTKELPEYAQKAKALSARGVSFSFVSVDALQSMDALVPQFLHDAGADFPGARHYGIHERVSPDDITRIFDKTWQGGLPATFVYRDGRLLKTFRGDSEPQALPWVEQHLAK